MAIRSFDDKAVLRTDGSYPDIATAYAKAERVFDPNDSPTSIAAGQKDAFGAARPTKVTMHQKAQMQTGPSTDRYDPSKMVQQGYTDTDLLT
jgi:hypothetical protein